MKRSAKVAPLFDYQAFKESVKKQRKTAEDLVVEKQKEEDEKKKDYMNKFTRWFKSKYFLELTNVINKKSSIGKELISQHFMVSLVLPEELRECNVRYNYNIVDTILKCLETHGFGTFIRGHSNNIEKDGHDSDSDSDEEDNGEFRNMEIERYENIESFSIFKQDGGSKIRYGRIVLVFSPEFESLRSFTNLIVHLNDKIIQDALEKDVEKTITTEGQEVLVVVKQNESKSNENTDEFTITNTIEE